MSKPARFEYARPATLADALALLQTPDAKVLAGGQSLVPLLNLRLARPSLLVDIGRLHELDSVRLDAEGNLRLGALVRHRQLLSDDTVATRAPLLRRAAAHVGHVAVRNRGTLGGSLVHADPTAELPAAMIALGARFLLRSRRGERWLAAEGFFEAPFTTAAREDELLVEAVVPPRPAEEGSAFLEVSPRLGDFAIVAVAALAQQHSGRLGGVRLAWSGAAGKPILADDLDRRLEGAALARPGLELVCRESVAALNPTPDFRGDAVFKRAALVELTVRALEEAAR